METLRCKTPAMACKDPMGQSPWKKPYLGYA